MGRGNITRRGRKSWRLKFDEGVGADGKRQIRYTAFKGSKRDAQKELTKLLGAADVGSLPKPSKWHTALRAGVARDGSPLSARTVKPAHKVLRHALNEAVRRETLARNVAAAISPPPVNAEEVVILKPEEVDLVLARLDGHPLYAIITLALATGMRRGELLATRLCDVDFDKATIKVERSLQETRAGLRFKGPKSKHGKRTISLPATAVAVLRAHWVRQLEHRAKCGLGKPPPDTLIFSTPEGAPLSPDNLSPDWRRACQSLALPMVMFHALRHTHASALIAQGLDIVQISKRLGHGSPAITLTVYSHLFKRDDSAAAAAAESLFRKSAGS